MESVKNQIRSTVAAAFAAEGVTGQVTEAKTAIAIAEQVGKELQVVLVSGEEVFNKTREEVTSFIFNKLEME